ncbi:GNAT family N-acetyltransferase [Gammaproteobacteria bacterium 45_16_T64]|nr:GNAT family N-acetyltransferase [Gammaproteobacteria bacterium 45_16_T64]
MYRIVFLNSIDEVESSEWDRVTNTDYPFIKHCFLLAMEAAGATVRKSGWQPQHLVVYNDDTMIALLPLYIKYHSYGEYVFDWAWADAYHRNGIEYYPKLLSAIPYTPSTGPRLCIQQGEKGNEIAALVARSLKEHAIELEASSIHLLFPQKELYDWFVDGQYMPRIGTQFHWFNQDFSSFDDFLMIFSSRKRKNVRKERKKIQQLDLDIETIEGADITQELWEVFYRFYQATYLKRSGHGGYLTADFFKSIAKVMPDNLVMMVAYESGNPIAAALNFKDENTLYGRYWGCEKEIEFLHFETCYYQGIEYCIQQQLAVFDAGAQGEHKISRGFTPIVTRSNHWIAHPQFGAAIEDFLVQEREGMKRYIGDCELQLPFKRSMGNSE